jgi:hypothetical protein
LETDVLRRQKFNEQFWFMQKEGAA